MSIKRGDVGGTGDGTLNTIDQIVAQVAAEIRLRTAEAKIDAERAEAAAVDALEYRDQTEQLKNQAADNATMADEAAVSALDASVQADISRAEAEMKAIEAAASAVDAEGFALQAADEANLALQYKNDAAQSADRAELEADRAEDAAAATGLPNPIVPETFLQAKADGSGYQAVDDEQMLNALGIPAGKPTADPAAPVTGSLLSGSMLAAGAIVEHGENANGRYWRWESGLQICLYWDSEPFIAETGTGVAIGFSPTKSVPYPAVFSGTRPIVVPSVRYITGTGTIWGSVPAMSLVNCQIRLYSGGTSEAYVGYVAIGWWK